MTKQEYIELYGYISNNEFKNAQKIAKTYGIDIKDYKLPIHQKLTKKNIDLMIKLRLHIKFNCFNKFKENFWRFDVEKNKVYAVNYTGHTLEYDGNKFSGDYKFCIHKNRNPINTQNEDLYYINGLYPVFSITSCLEQDIKKVINTNSSWWKEETKTILITPYNT